VRLSPRLEPLSDGGGGTDSLMMMAGMSRPRYTTVVQKTTGPGLNPMGFNMMLSQLLVAFARRGFASQFEGCPVRR
jgi:hypothetical protein